MKDINVMDSYFKTHISTTSKSTKYKSKKSRNDVSIHYMSQERSEINKALDSSFLGRKSPYHNNSKNNDISLFLPNLSINTQPTNFPKSSM